MSTPTLSPAAGDFDDLEFAAIVADFHTQPLGEPLPDEDHRITRPRPARGAEKAAAIDESLGIYRHRTGERRN